jgi:multiple RNA-binding domain-containing protein 1
MSTEIESVTATSRLIVKNLPPKTNDEKLRQSFSGHGQITDIQLKFTKDGKFRNFAFVGYKTGDEAQRAQSYLNNSYFGASKIVSFGIWYGKGLGWSFK